MLKERLMNPGTATFGSDGNVKPKELYEAICVRERDGRYFVWMVSQRAC